jgi:hypothetical protein
MPRIGDLKPQARVDDYRWPDKRDLNYEDPLGAIGAGTKIGGLFAGIPILDEFGELIPAPLVEFVLSMIDDIPILGDLLEIILGVSDGEGIDPTELLTGFFGGLRAFLPFLPDLGGGGLNPIEAAADFIQGILNPANILAFFNPGLIPGLDASKITSGSFADGIVPGVISLMNGIFGGLTGWFPNENENANQSAVAEATASQTQVLARIAAQVADLQAAMSDDDPTTIVVEDNFEYSGAPNPTKWHITDLGPATTGNLEVDGHQLVFDQSGTNDRTFRLEYIGPDHTATVDNYGIKIILGSWITTNSSSPATHDLLIRANLAFTRYVRIRIAPKWIEVAAFVDGVKTVIDTASIAQPAAGSIISVEAGTDADPDARVFAVTINTTTYGFEDVAAVSHVGPDYRERGLQLHATQRTFWGANQQLAPGPVAHWVSENTAA